jgi:NAD(P)-dependent dehydrogenase (short-subunit alcohol dehydrogenase family)
MASDALDMTGKVVIVTGGAKGVGKGITEAFLARGAQVAICGRKTPEAMPTAGGQAAVFVQTDVREVAQLDSLVASVTERWGRIDVLVNNAGGSPYVEAKDASPRFTQSIVTLNLLAPLWLSQRVHAVMVQQAEGGSIVNIASVSGTRPSPGTSAYGAAKAGLLNLTRTLAVEWAPRVRVNAIVAGLVHTEQSHLHYGDDAGVAAVAATVPFGRMAEPSDIGDACLLLSSPLARYVTGASLELHGGGEWPAFLTAARAAAAR